MGRQSLRKWPDARPARFTVRAEAARSAVSKRGFFSAPGFALLAFTGCGFGFWAVPYFIRMITLVSLALGPYTIGRLSVALGNLRNAMLVSLVVNVGAVVFLLLAARKLPEDERRVKEGSVSPLDTTLHRPHGRR